MSRNDKTKPAARVIASLSDGKTLISDWTNRANANLKSAYVRTHYPDAQVTIVRGRIPVDIIMDQQDQIFDNGDDAEAYLSEQNNSFA